MMMNNTDPIPIHFLFTVEGMPPALYNHNIWCALTSGAQHRHSLGYGWRSADVGSNQQVQEPISGCGN